MFCFVFFSNKWIKMEQKNLQKIFFSYIFIICINLCFWWKDWNLYWVCQMSLSGFVLFRCALIDQLWRLAVCYTVNIWWLCSCITHFQDLQQELKPDCSLQLAVRGLILLQQGLVWLRIEDFIRLQLVWWCKFWRRLLKRFEQQIKNNYN